MINVEVYGKQHKQSWNQFILTSKNGVFLFHRDYMEYHSDRFADSSLLFWKEENLIAVMPANLADDTLVSHGGLTFGGVISNSRMRASTMLQLFDALKDYLREQGVRKIIYKAVPHIYHAIPSEEDLYALFIFNAKLIRRDVSSAVRLSGKLAFSKGRKWCIKQSKSNGLEVRRSFDFKSFFEIEEHVLGTKYDLKPVHTADEMELLASRFPENIKLFASYKDDNMLAGLVIYESDMVAHAQYSSASDEGKRTGALDCILDFLFNEYYCEKQFFDFGISTEDYGRYMNAGLIDNKESFGARAIVYDFYEVDITT
jgi:hypothetical protein